MSTRREAKTARYKLKAAIHRADELAARCLAQTCDGDLKMVDRETAEKRLQVTLKASADLERSLGRLNQQLEQTPAG